MDIKQKYIIEVSGLSKAINGVPVIKDINLQLKHGEVFGFLGTNGAGKTTTIRLLCGLLTPDSGEGYCLGYNLRTEAAEIKTHVGYMPQHFSLYRNLTVKENLEFIAEMYSLTNRRERIDTVMEQTGLAAKQSTLAGRLSGGWKQRLSFAACLLRNPLLLLLDEPTASIDPKSRSDFWELIKNIASEGTTILLSSHNMEEMERCDRLAFLSDGKILMYGTLQEIVTKVNLTTWVVTDKHLSLLAKQLKVLPGIKQLMVFNARLHVSSTDAIELEQTIAPYLNEHWTKVESTLEDVFVWLSNK